MRAMDKEAIEQVGIPGVVLMETAGRAVARAALDLLTSRTPLASGASLMPCNAPRVALVCGTGNNGGDGFVAARVLAEHGIDCEVFLVQDPEGISGDARVFYEALLHCNAVVSPLQTTEDLARAEASLRVADVLVDAIFGTGLCRDISGHIASVVGVMNACAGATLAVDVPSGLAADTGATLGVAINATATVTMGAPKIANIGAPGFSRNGALIVAEIGIPGNRMRRVANAFVTEGADVRSLLSGVPANAHKVAKGHVLAIAGSSGKRGAGRLTGLAALRAGAGLVTLGAASLDAYAADPIMTAQVATTDELTLAWSAKHALVIGPGMHTDPQAAALVVHAIRHSPVPCILDADALNHLATDSTVARDAKAPLVITPHPGEAARLLGVTSAEVQADRMAAVRLLASQTQAVVVLKGARTCIADGRSGESAVSICEQGGAELATAGTGDVLAGMVGALLAQGLDAFDAARVAVYWHGVAGGVALRNLGGPGVIATDVIAAIPAARSEIAASN
jgi:NAD(P)H-hydrate epimerase